MLGQEGSIYFSKEERQFIRECIYACPPPQTKSERDMFNSITMALDFADEEAHD